MSDFRFVILLLYFVVPYHGLFHGNLSLLSIICWWWVLFCLFVCFVLFLRDLVFKLNVKIFTWLIFKRWLISWRAFVLFTLGKIKVTYDIGFRTLQQYVFEHIFWNIICILHTYWVLWTSFLWVQLSIKLHVNQPQDQILYNPTQPFNTRAYNRRGKGPSFQVWLNPRLLICIPDVCLLIKLVIWMQYWKF